MTSRVLVALRIDAAPARVFEAFTAEINQWWQPNGLFEPSLDPGGRLSIEPGGNGRLLVTSADGVDTEIGRIRTWEPPEQLIFTWRPTSFTADQQTEVHVRFEPVDGMTRVVVEHVGWDAIPREHAARHGFPLFAFHRRLAEWWQDLLASLGERSGNGD